MKLLITGGCGFLGHHLVEHFLKADPDTEIVILDRLSYASAGFDRLRDISVFDDKRVRVLGCDLRVPVAEGVIREIGPVDYIIHTAAETHVDNSITNPLPFFESNVIGTHHLLKLAQEPELRSVGRMPHTFLVSTDEVYGPAKWDAPGFTEDAPFNPTNPYAASKAGAEALANSYRHTYGVPVTICNGMNFFGERQHPEKFIVKCILYALAGKKLSIHADAARERSGTRFYLHCRNFAAAVGFLIDGDVEGAIALPKKVHIVGEREISNLEMATMIAGFVGKPLNYELVDFHSSRPGHDLRYAMADTYFKARGYTHPIPIEESLERTVRWYLDRRNKKWLEWK